MAYFPNGTSFACWQGEHCSDCLNYRDNGSGSFGCAITDVHWSHEYDESTNAAVLNDLILEDGADAGKCRMRLTREDMETEARAANHQLDLRRYRAAMAEMKEPTR
jgi:hypothetical protein